MKLVHVLPYYAPAWGFGGVVRAAYGLTVAQAAQGHPVIVMTTDVGDGGARLPDLESTLAGVQVRRCRNRLPVLRRLNLSTPAGMRRLLREVLPGADILHLHEFRTVEALIALPLAGEMDIPAVLSPHGTLTYMTGRRVIKQGWDSLLGPWTARRIRGVTALTEDEAADVRGLWDRLGVPPPDVGIVPNGVNLEEFADLPPRGRFRSELQIPPDVPLVLFLGRLHERKGAHLLLDALPHLPGAWLAIVGPDEGQLAALRDQADRLSVTGRVVFTGLLTGPAKLAAMADADVLALPAVGEGLPMVALEAMAAGLPVALSRECHLPEAAEAGAGVTLEALNGEGIARSLAPLLADRVARDRMGAAGRALAAERFTWSAAAEAMSQFYAGLR